MGRKILRRAEKDKIKSAKKIVFFLDYDGTLTPIRKTPGLAKISKSTKNILKKLSRKPWSKVFIISGRSLKDVRSLINLGSLYYIGNHGMELRGPGLSYINPSAKKFKSFIQKSCQILKKKVHLRGIILENKIYTLSVHYRLLRKSKVQGFKKSFFEIIKTLKKTNSIKITEGKKVLEVRPDINWDKGKSVSWVLKRIKPKNFLPVCIGDDRTDEDAFRALGKKGISILVSRIHRKTKAGYRLKSPKDTAKFLEFILKVKK